MSKVVSISSQVVYGHVGNSTSAFVLQRMGHEVLAVPTILLSNRPGYKAIAGEPLEPRKLDAMLGAALENGWLNNAAAIMTGYLPSAEHASLCERWVRRIKDANPQAIYLCDPIIGDEPGGIYIKEAAASAMRDRLLPLADILTPNSFELFWLSGTPIADAGSAVAAARSLMRPAVVITSAPAPQKHMLANILVEGDATAATAAPREIVHAHGTGDFFASVFLAHRLNGLSNAIAMRAASAAIGHVLHASAGQSELVLVETQASWAATPPTLAPLVAGIDATGTS
ncbi:MAG: pyridoxal kinase [Rhodomicrobium sp.]